MAYPPLDDAERVARHYGVSIDEACEMLRTKSVEELLPERGTGLIAGTARSRTGNPDSQGITMGGATIGWGWIIIGILAFLALRRK